MAFAMAGILPILFGLLPVFADPPPERPADRKPDAADATYFNISFQAQEALDRAEQNLPAVAGAPDADWADAARAFHEIGEKFGASLIAEPGAPSRLYISVREFVNRKIADWPAEGLAAYRAAFESSAAAALAELQNPADIDARVRLAERFYATNAGAQSLDQAAELAMENADFEAARRWYERLLADHPDREQFESHWKAKLALCLAHQGDLAPLEKLIASLPPSDNLRASAPSVDKSVDWAGKSQPLSDFLRLTLDQCRRDGTPDPVSARPELLGGAPHRRGQFPTTASAEARWWRFNAFGRLLTGEIAEGYESRIARLEAYHRALTSGRLLASQPVAATEPLIPQSLNPSIPLIFLHDARSAWAIDPQNPDRPVWQFDLSQVLPAPAPWNAEESAPPLYTSLYANGRLYVHFEREITDTGSDHITAASTLVCLDAANGSLIWRNDLDGFVSPFEEARLDGAPILHRAALYAVARRRKPFGFEACYLIRLDPADGRLVWSVHLGEAATGSYGYSRATLTFPAAQGDLVFVPTNLGGVAAVSTSTGRVAWAHQYDSRFGANEGAVWPDTTTRPLRAWHYNSAMLWKDAVVCMPLDNDAILVLAQDDGRELFKIPADSIHRPQTLVGLAGNWLYTAGTQVVCYDLAARKIAWQRPLELGQLFGRGALTTTGLFLPTDRSLLHYPLDGGPARHYRWSIEDAGNLLVLPDQIVVAAPNSVFGLVARQDAFARLDRRMQERPDDPLIAFSLAELAFNTGEYQRGLDAVHSAVDRVGGFARLTDEPLRRRFFKTLTQFATALLEDAPDERDSDAAPSIPQSLNPSIPRLQTAVTLLKLAGQCPPGPADRATQCLLLARALLESNDQPGAVQAYQRILADRGLRRLKLELRPVLRPPWRARDDDAERQSDDADGPTVDLAPAVTSWIARIIKLHGPEAYAAVARQAADRLEIAQSQIQRGGAKTDASNLLEVADAFPNSPAALEALVTHADYMTKRLDWPAAARSYRRALTSAESKRVSEDDDPSAHSEMTYPDLIRRYADVLIAADRPADAAAWLHRGARDYPNHRFASSSPQSLNPSIPQSLVSFSVYGRLRLGDRDFTDPANNIELPPITDTYHRLFPDRVSVLEPLFPDLPDTRWDALLTYAGRQVEARHPATGRSLWSKPFPSSAQPVLVGMDADRYVFATPYRLFALTRTSGQLAWQVGEEPPDDVHADPESLPAYAQYFLTPRRLFAATDRGALNCTDVKTGNLVWENKSAGSPSGQLLADDDSCCYGVWQGGNHSINVLDAATGRLIRQLTSDEKGPAQSLHWTTDLGPRGLLVVRSSTIERYDLASAKPVWRIAVPEHFVAATLQLNADSLIVSADGRRLTCFDLADAAVRWRSSPFAGEAGSLWCRQAAGVLYVASDVALLALDADDGHTLWTAPCPAARAVQPPRLLKDRIIVITPEAPPKSKNRRRDKAPELDDGEAAQYHLQAFHLDNGKPAPLEGKHPIESPNAVGPIVTEPIASFGGLFLRDNALLLLDANRLIGYVAKNDE
ncbi:MAG TPA: PQQ-binding-like beta-propeller repeat protein [Phycisphaerae bacterium]|nr:PQQ-binding-like beta-propeller repeat protein [Phycisphaerae bacterium]